MSAPVAAKSRVPLEDRLRAVEEVRSRKASGQPLKVKEIGAKYGVSEPMVYAWMRDADAGRLFDPDAKPPTKAKQARRRHSEEFKAKCVEAYRTQPEKQVIELAEELGIKAGYLHRWVRAAGVTRRTANAESTALAKVNGKGRANGRAPVVVHPPEQLVLPTPPEPVDLAAENAVLKSKLSRAKEFMHHLVEAAF